MQLLVDGSSFKAMIPFKLIFILYFKFKRMLRMSRLSTDKRKKILAIIPARGGSKGVIRKNIHQLAGKPLIAWTIETALSCSFLDRVIVSTDDEMIRNVAIGYGAEAPFKRPSEFAQDNTSDLPVYQQTLSWLRINQDYCPEIVVWLRPTSPLRSSRDIHDAVILLEKTNADWARTITKVQHPIFWTKKLDGDRLVPFLEDFDDSAYNCRRQDQPIFYLPNGAVDVAWSTTITENELLYDGDVRGVVMPFERSVNIDTEYDFWFAEKMIKKSMISHHDEQYEFKQIKYS